MIYLDNNTDVQRVFIPKNKVDTVSYNPNWRLQNKNWEITENGVTVVSPDPGYDAISGGSITVYVSGGGGGETEFKHLTATKNGEYPATGNTAFSGVTVDVQPNNQSKTALFTKNGTQVITFDAGYSGLQEVEVVVNLPSDIVNQTKNVLITGNTATTITYDQGYTGLESVGIIVNVPDPEQTALTATTNGDYTPSGYYGYSAVTVNVPGPEMTSLTATTNGNYTPTGFDGYSAVTVDVPGVRNQDKSITISEDMGQGTNYISAHTVVTADTGYTGLGEVEVDVAIPCTNSMFFREPITKNGTYYISMDPEIEEYQDPPFLLGAPARQAGFVVQVTSTPITMTAITAELNNTTYYPGTYGAEGFSAVTTSIDTRPYYNSGYTEGWQDGYNGVVTSWDQVSGVTSLVYTSTTIGERWSLSKLKGVNSANTDYDIYPYYAQLGGAIAHLLSATTIYQEMPEAEDLSRLMYDCHRSISIAILNATQLSSLYSAFAFSSVYSVTINATRPAIYGGCSFYHTFRSSSINNPSITAYTTNLYGCFADCTNLTTLENTRFYPANTSEYYEPIMYMGVESMCDGCSSLHTIPEWDWSAVRGIETGYQPFRGCTALSTLGGFSGLGESFETSYSGHSLSLVDCTNPYDSTAVTQSLTNVISKLGTVPAEVTDATVLINSTWASLVGSATLSTLQTVAAGKNWTLSVA